MAKVFYDRSGKAHTIGGKKAGGEKSESKSEKGSSSGHSHGGHSKKAHSEKSFEGKKRGHGGGSGSKRDDQNAHHRKSSFGKNKHIGEARFDYDDRRRQEKSDARSYRQRGEEPPAPKHGNRDSSPWAERSKGGGRDFQRGDRDANRGGERSFGRDRKGGTGGREERSFKKEHHEHDSGRSRGKFGQGGGRGGRDDRKGGRGGRDFKGGRGGGGRPGGDRRGRSRGPRMPVEINPDWIKLKGVIDKNKKGSAFLVFDRRDLEDLFIPRFFNEQLFHGDRVEVYVNDAGEIENLKVLEHRFKEIFGKVYLDERSQDGFGKKKSKARTGTLIYERKKAKEEIYLPSVPLEVKEGDWVKAELIFGEDGQGAISATILQVIGQTLPATFDIQMVAGEFNLTEHHTYDAVKQAESYTLEIPGKDELGRTDLRHIPFFTIDGERARDFDDAVYVERTESKGFRLWVAIADVSHYVKIGTPLDREAYARGTSVYFPERAFHMLPRALSEELCSLKPNVPRLSMAVSIEYSRDGDKGQIKLYDGIIESRRRATYTEIEAEKEDPKHAELFALYRILRQQRSQRGSIDFDFPEAEIILDEKTGEPSDIVVRERNDAHRLIEEFMIAANEAVTEWMIERKLPFIYRIHEEPSAEAMDKFRKLAKNMGVQLADKGGIPRPKVLAEFIRTLKEHPAEVVLATALLRSMRQAIYSSTYGEHYGLASNAYTHFTSPIRRYPDLVVHRQLRAALHREQNNEPKLTGEQLEEIQVILDEIAEHCSYRERIASDAERESIRFKQIRLMAKHIGEEFEGKINGLGERGMYVQIFHPYCEGMVPVDTIGDDYYEFLEDRMMLMGRRTRQTFQIGQKVKIRVVRVDLDSRQIEFELWD